jgi:hypothetical protein
MQTPTNTQQTGAPLMAAPKPQYFVCPSCAHLHPAGFEGDCRDDEARVTQDTLDARYGVDGWEEVEPE